MALFSWLPSALNVSCESPSDLPSLAQNVGSWGISGRQFRAAGGLLLARSGSSIGQVSGRLGQHLGEAGRDLHRHPLRPATGPQAHGGCARSPATPNAGGTPRWTAAGPLETQKTFRRLEAYRRQLPILRQALLSPAYRRRKSQRQRRRPPRLVPSSPNP